MDEISLPFSAYQRMQYRHSNVSLCSLGGKPGCVREGLSTPVVLRNSGQREGNSRGSSGVHLSVVVEDGALQVVQRAFFESVVGPRVVGEVSDHPAFQMVHLCPLPV